MRELLVPAAIRRLKNDVLDSNKFTQVVADDLGFDPVGRPYAGGWLFQGLDNAGNPYRQIEGSGKAAVVLHARGGWGLGNGGRATYPTLTAMVYADATRNLDGTATARDSDARAFRVWEHLDRWLHCPGNDQHWWDATGMPVYVASSTREGEPSVDDVPSAENTVRLVCRYNVVFG